MDVLWIMLKVFGVIAGLIVVGHVIRVFIEIATAVPMSDDAEHFKAAEERYKAKELIKAAETVRSKNQTDG